MSETKSETKHTKGPWEVSEHSGRKGELCVVGNSQRIFEPCRMDEANARRIVACVNACEGLNPDAAPDLLHALENMVEVTKGFSWPSDIDKKSFLSAARAAIAKAEDRG